MACVGCEKVKKEEVLYGMYQDIYQSEVLYYVANGVL